MYCADLYLQKDEKPTRIMVTCTRDVERQADALGAYAVTEYLDGGKASMLRFDGVWIQL